MVADALQADRILVDHAPVVVGSSSSSVTDPPQRPSRRGYPALRSDSDIVARVERLWSLGWGVEDHDGYRLARLHHRQIVLFNDGRVVFKDPTISGRHECDVEWLKVTAFMWPDTTF